MSDASLRLLDPDGPGSRARGARESSRGEARLSLLADSLTQAATLNATLSAGDLGALRPTASAIASARAGSGAQVLAWRPEEPPGCTIALASWPGRRRRRGREAAARLGTSRVLHGTSPGSWSTYATGALVGGGRR